MNIPFIQQDIKLDNKNRFFLPAKLYHALENSTDSLFVVLAQSPELDGEHYIKLIDQAVLDLPRDPLTCDSLSVLKNQPSSTLSIDKSHRILLWKQELQRLFGDNEKTYTSSTLFCASLWDHIILLRKELSQLLTIQ